MFSQEDYDRAAEALGVPDYRIKAVTAVEAGGETFWHLGTREVVPVRFEAHIFGKLTDHIFDDKYPELSCQSWTPSLAARTWAGAWTQLERARRLAPEKADEAASWGAFQIMGYHWRKLDYSSVHEFVDSMSDRGDDGQMDAFVRFVKADANIRRALRGGYWDTFETYYNGGGQGGAYAEKLRAAEHLYRDGGGQAPRLLRMGTQGPDVRDLQIALSMARADGIFGPATQAAVKAFQSRNGLAVDGEAGSKTKGLLGLL